MNLNQYFDHTLLKPEAASGQIERVCREAVEHHFASVCVNPYRTKQAAGLLKETGVRVCTVIGFPLGASVTKVKQYEAKCAIEDGAEEIDMVLNIGALKDENYEYVRNDIRGVKEACGNVVLKVIIETCLLTDEEKIQACRLSAEAGADFVKTSTGFSLGGAKAEDVALMKQAVEGRAKVKASGGIHSYADAMAMIEAGADRLGTSATLEIISGQA